MVSRSYAATPPSSAIEIFNHLAEGVFLADPDDAHLAFGVFERIAGVRRVHHDGRAELAAARAGRGFGRIRRAQYIADFADLFMAFVHPRGAFLRPLLVQRRGAALARVAA